MCGNNKSVFGCVAFSAAIVTVGFFPAVHSIAGTSSQRALAALTVARVQIQLANERPQLPDHSRTTQLQIERLETEIEHFKQHWVPRPPTPIIPEPEPISINFAKVAPINDLMPAQLVIGTWDKGCPACDRLERDILRLLVPRGWSVGNHSENQIQFTHLPDTEAVPQIFLYQNGKEIEHWEGYQDPATLSHRLRDAWDSAPTPTMVPATGLSGSINGQTQIRQALEWFRSHIGDDVTAEMRWDRSGAQSFPLLAKGDWSAAAIFGQFGHIELSAIGAKNLPIESVGFEYRINGDDVSLDVDAIAIQGLALKLGLTSHPKSSQLAGTAPVPSQFGLFGIWTILSVMHDVWSMLWPSVDLTIGGNVSATAILHGDALTIEFSQGPQIRIVHLFNFNLRVTRVVITESNVHFDFTGSRLIKSRDFVVK